MMSSAILPSEPVTSGQKIDRFRQPVARDMPGGDGNAEAEFLAQRLLNLKTLVAERSQRAGGARELADEHARLQLGEPLGMTVEHRKPDRGLVAERHRQRLLQMGAARHRRVAIALREIGKDAAQRGNIGFDDLKAGADLQDHGGIHDVLRGRAPMHIASGVAALFHHLVHQRQDRIADDIGLLAKQVEIQRRDVGPLGDLVGRLRRDHAAARLGLRQRDLDLGVAGDQAEIRKHLAHGRRPEGVAEQDGIEDGGRGREGGHGFS